MMSDYNKTIELTAAAQNSAGKSSELFAKSNDTIAMKIQTTKNYLEQLINKVINALNFKDFFDKINDLLSKISNFNAKNISTLIIGLAANIKRVYDTYKNIVSSDLTKGLVQKITQTIISLSKLIDDSGKKTIDSLCEYLKQQLSKNINEVESELSMGGIVTPFSSKTVAPTTSKPTLEQKRQQVIFNNTGIDPSWQKNNTYQLAYLKYATQALQGNLSKIAQKFVDRIYKKNYDTIANNISNNSAFAKATDQEKTSAAITATNEKAIGTLSQLSSAASIVTQNLLQLGAGALDLWGAFKSGQAIGIGANGIDEAEQMASTASKNYYAGAISDALSGNIIKASMSAIAGYVEKQTAIGTAEQQATKAAQVRQSLDGTVDDLSDKVTAMADYASMKVADMNETLNSDSSLDDILDTYKELSHKVELTKDELQTYDDMVNQLQESYPQLIQSYDSVTGEINLNIEALKKEKEALEEKRDAEADEATFLQAVALNYKDQYNAYKNYQSIQDGTIKTQNSKTNYNVTQGDIDTAAAKGTKTGAIIGGAAMSALGAAAVGAAIGSAVPILGTAIGAAIGIGVGAITGAYVGHDVGAATAKGQSNDTVSAWDMFNNQSGLTNEQKIKILKENKNLLDVIKNSGENFTDGIDLYSEDFKKGNNTLNALISDMRSNMISNLTNNTIQSDQGEVPLSPGMDEITQTDATNYINVFEQQLAQGKSVEEAAKQVANGDTQLLKALVDSFNATNKQYEATNKNTQALYETLNKQWGEEQGQIGYNDLQNKGITDKTVLNAVLAMTTYGGSQETITNPINWEVKLGSKAENTLANLLASRMSDVAKLNGSSTSLSDDDSKAFLEALLKLNDNSISSIEALKEIANGEKVFDFWGGVNGAQQGYANAMLKVLESMGIKSDTDLLQRQLSLNAQDLRQYTDTLMQTNEQQKNAQTLINPFLDEDGKISSTNQALIKNIYEDSSKSLNEMKEDLDRFGSSVKGSDGAIKSAKESLDEQYAELKEVLEGYGYSSNDIDNMSISNRENITSNGEYLTEKMTEQAPELTQDQLNDNIKNMYDTIQNTIQAQGYTGAAAKAMLSIDPSAYKDQDYATAIKNIGADIQAQAKAEGEEISDKTAQEMAGDFMADWDKVSAGIFNFTPNSVKGLEDVRNQVIESMSSITSSFQSTISDIFSDITNEGFFDPTKLTDLITYLDTIGLKLEDIVSTTQNGDLTIDASGQLAILDATEKTIDAQGGIYAMARKNLLAEIATEAATLDEAVAKGAVEAASEDNQDANANTAQNIYQAAAMATELTTRLSEAASAAEAIGEFKSFLGKITGKPSAPDTASANKNKKHTNEQITAKYNKKLGRTLIKLNKGVKEEDLTASNAALYDQETKIASKEKAVKEMPTEDPDYLAKANKNAIERSAKAARTPKDSSSSSGSGSKSGSGSDKDKDTSKDISDAQKAVDEARESLEKAAKELKEAKEGTDEWIESVDRLINYTTRLTNIELQLTNNDTTLKSVENIQDAFKALSDQAVLRQNQTNLLTAENQKYQTGIQERLQQFLNGSYRGVSYNQFLEQYNDGSFGLNMNALQNAKVNDTVADNLKTMVDDMNKYQQEVLKNENTIAELEQTRLSEHKEYLSDYVSLQDKVAEVLKANAQEEIDTEKEKYSSMEEAQSQYLDALEKAINKQRQLRDEQQSYDNLAQQEAKLSLMERDTSNSNSTTAEIAQQRKTVQDTRQSLLDTKVDNIVSNLKEMYDTQKEERDAVLEIKEQIIQDSENDNAFNELAAEIVAGFGSVEDVQAWFMENDSNLNGKTVEAVEKEMLDIKDTAQGAFDYQAEQQLKTSDVVEQNATSVADYAATTSESLTGSAERVVLIAEEKADEAILDAEKAYQDALDNLNEKLEALQDAINGLNDAASSLGDSGGGAGGGGGVSAGGGGSDDNDTSSKKSGKARYTYEQMEDINAKDSEAFKGLMKGIGSGQIIPSGFKKGTMANALAAWSHSNGNPNAVWLTLRNGRKTDNDNKSNNNNNNKKNNTVYNAKNHPTGAGDYANQSLYPTKKVEQSRTNLNNTQYQKYSQYMAHNNPNKTGESSTKTYNYNGKTYSAITFRRKRNGTVEYALWKKGKMGNYQDVVKYAQGGMVDYTGPAWVDGTKSKPEAFLSAKDTENIQSLTSVLSGLFDKVSINDSTAQDMADTITNNTQNNGENTFNINLDIGSIDSDYDVEDMVATMKEEIVKAANPIGSNTMLNR